ncbi:MAG: ribosome assembly RNA-binding protein YhbY [Pseudomonadota bacterium]
MNDTHVKALSNAQRRFLRGLCHNLKPVIAVGNNGLTDAVLAELDNALSHHELVKVKLRADRPTRSAWAEAAASASGAAVVQQIGQTLSLYRPHPKKPQITLPR